MRFLLNNYVKSNASKPSGIRLEVNVCKYQVVSLILHVAHKILALYMW